MNTCNLVYKVSTQTPWNSNSRQEMMTDKGTLEWPILQTKQEYRDKGKRTPFPEKELCTWKPEGIDEQWLGSFFFDGTKHMLSGSQACPSCSHPALPVLRKVKNWTMESISWHEMMWASCFRWRNEHVDFCTTLSFSPPFGFVQKYDTSRFTGSWVSLLTLPFWGVIPRHISHIFSQGLMTF